MSTSQTFSQPFIAFLLTGLIPWMWFSKSVSGSSGSILSANKLMLQVGLPSVVFPLITTLQASLKQIPIFALLLSFIWLQGYSPGIHWLALIPVITVQLLLILVCACAIAAVIPFIRDLTYLVPTGLTFLMFLSGIFYDYRNISQEWQEVFLMNPVAFILKCYREILMDRVTPDLHMLMLFGLVCIVICVLLLFIYKRLRHTFPRIIME